MPPDLSSPFPTCPDKKKKKEIGLNAGKYAKIILRCVRLSCISLGFGKSFLKSSGGNSGKIKFDQIKWITS